MALLNLLAAVALLLWGSRQMDRGLRAVLQPLAESLLPHARRGRHAALGLGFAAGLLRPAEADRLPWVTLDAGDAALPPARAFAVLLGAGFGAAAAMLLLAHAPAWAFHALTIAGVAAALVASRSRLRHVGLALVGAGLVLLALRILAASSAGGPSAFGDAVAQGLAQDTLLAMTIGALLVLALRSPFAAVLLLAATGGAWLQPSAAVAVLLGIHLGAAGMAFVRHRADPAAHRLAAALLLATLLAAAVVLLLRADLAQLLADGRGELLMLLNAALLGFTALCFLNLAGPLTRFVQRWLPVESDAPPGDAGLARLRADDLEVPSLALAASLREVMRLADLVDRMLRLARDVFVAGDDVAAQAIRDAEQRVNTRYRALKNYMAQIPRRPLVGDEQWRWEEQLNFLIAAEQVGDRVDRMLADIESKKLAPKLAYPPAAEAEVMALHAQLTRNLRLAASVCLERGVAAATELAASKNQFRQMEQSFRAAHLARLVAGDAATVASSSLHLNLLAGFVDMNDQLCAFARSFLELRNARGCAAGAGLITFQERSCPWRVCTSPRTCTTAAAPPRC